MPCVVKADACFAEPRDRPQLPFVSKYAPLVGAIGLDGGAIGAFVANGPSVVGRRVDVNEAGIALSSAVTVADHCCNIATVSIAGGRSNLAAVADVAAARALRVVGTDGSVSVAVPADEAAAEKRHRGEGDAPDAWRLHTVAAWPGGKSLSGGMCYSACDAPGSSDAICVSHEEARQVHIFDTTTGAATNVLELYHMPTRVAQGPQNTLIVCEGCIVSSWDPRMSGTNACVARLTLLDDAMDAVYPHALRSGVPEHSVLVACCDRSLTVFDQRKWSRGYVESNVLKYYPTSCGIAGTVGHHADVLAVGVDAEARAITVPLDPAVQKKSAPKATAAQDEPAPLQGAFRQRLATAVHCRSSWHGAATTAIGVPAALAVSTHGELFVATTTPSSVA